MGANNDQPEEIVFGAVDPRVEPTNLQSANSCMDPVHFLILKPAQNCTAETNAQEEEPDMQPPKQSFKVNYAMLMAQDDASAQIKSSPEVDEMTAQFFNK